ncbi:MAG: ATP-dependent protease, partial [Deltaproteobacteria bacterium]|nr:ATP-dependent protease [Deltaproteobacteria bacterium]
IATLLEILDPEQNHLFHDKYTQTTVDVDLSNFHFVLTANTLETVPPPVVNRCEVILLDRYSVDEKVEIAKHFLIQRVRQRHEISEDLIFIDSKNEDDLLRYLIKTYTHEAGVRELERIIRTLFLRIMRKEVVARRGKGVRITRQKVKEYLEAPQPPRRINEEDRVGEMMGLGINVDLGIGSVIPIQATLIQLGASDKTSRGFLSMVHATGNIQKIMDESRKVATTAILHCGQQLGICIERAERPIHLHFMGGSTPKDGPSAGGSIALALASVLTAEQIRRDVAMTGEIDTQGRITRVGGLDVKLETAVDAGCKTLIIPYENWYGEEGIERLPEALKEELQLLTYEEWKGDHQPFDHERQMLQIVAVEDILQAAEVSFIDPGELTALDVCFDPLATSMAQRLAVSRRSPRPHMRVMYVKDALELNPEDHETAIVEDHSTCHFLVLPRARRAIADKYPVLEEKGLLRDFDPASHNVASVLTDLTQTFRGDSNLKTRLSFVAPFFFLVRDRFRLEAFSAGPSFEPLRLFANNYTIQGVKIKACKLVLNRLYAVLSQLDESELEGCTFLKKKDGVYVVDMSFIPEKYRLDTARA